MRVFSSFEKKRDESLQFGADGKIGSYVESSSGRLLEKPRFEGCLNDTVKLRSEVLHL